MLVALLMAALGGLNATVWATLALAVAMAAVGFADDRLDLSPFLRLGLQCLIGVSAGVLLAGAWPVAVVVPISVLATVTVVNAVNFMDGVNGITAVASSVAFLFYAWCFAESSETGLAYMSLIVTGALLGFLLWNARGAIFLGDVGSYFVGSWWALSALTLGLVVAEPLLALAPLTVYVADVGWALVKKAHARQPLMGAHRGHVYQRLTDLGFSHLAVSAIVGLFTFSAAIGAKLAEATDMQWGGYLWLAVVALVYLACPRLMVLKDRSG